jgi:hypothetical protein
MTIPWQDWCRFCAKPGFNTKFECTADIKAIFKVLCAKDSEKIGFLKLLF